MYIMSLKKIVRGILFILLLFQVQLATAQHNHGGGGGEHNHGSAPELNAPQHGGKVVDLGKYKIELITNMYLKKDQLTFFLYKGEMKPLSNENITGTMTLQTEDGSSDTVALVPRGTDFFLGTVNSAQSFQCIITFNIKGKKITTIYSHSGIGNEIIYSCTMHPKIKSTKPDSCSICGMDLIPISKDNNTQKDSHSSGGHHH